MSRFALLLPLLLLATVPAASAQTTAWINELHYDNSGTDTGEAVEVVLPFLAPPAAYTVLLYNGNPTLRNLYGTPRTLDTCTPGASVDVNADTVPDYLIYNCAFAVNGIQNGGTAASPEPDGLALVGPDPLNPDYPIVQFLSYEGAFVASNGAAAGVMSTDILASEEPPPAAGVSLQLAGTGAAYESFAWSGPVAATPGLPNTGQTFALPPQVPAGQMIGANPDGAGWRQMAGPLAGVTVDQLAGQNLVQGVPAFAADPVTYEAQYPAAAPNILTAYTAAGFESPDHTAVNAALGRGFFWYFYDAAFGPFPETNGTSQSYELPRAHVVGGYALPNSRPDARDLIVSFLPNPDGFYLLGNPTAVGYRLRGIQLISSGVFSTTMQVFQPTGPASGTYVAITRGSVAGDSIASFQGVWAEVTPDATPSAAVAFAYDATALSTTSPPFIGRTAEGPRVGLRLEGTTATGAPVLDLAAAVRFEHDAVVEWDQHDASKLTPPGALRVLIAPTGIGPSGPAHRKAVESRPPLAGLVEVPVAFTATEAGTFTLAADLAAVPAEWGVRLRDTQTGAETDLRAAPYTFAADAGDWTARFVLTVASAVVAGEPGPSGFELTAVAPNPARERAALALRVATGQHVTAEVFDALGRRVALLHDGAVAAGADLPLVVEAGALAPGAYVVRVTGETFSETRRLTVVR